MSSLRSVVSGAVNLQAVLPEVSVNANVIPLAPLQRVPDSKQGLVAPALQASRQAATGAPTLSRAALRAAAVAALPEKTAVPSQPAMDIGLRLGDKKYCLSPAGYFQVGTAPKAATFDVQGAQTAYRAAAALTRQSPDFLKKINTDIKAAMLAHCEKMFAAGQETEALPGFKNQKFRSAAATTLQTLIDGCTAQQAGLRERALQLYVAMALREPYARLRASMYLNIQHVESTLSGQVATDMSLLRDLVMPSTPPYEAWFATNGAQRINIVHNAHEDQWKGGAFGESPVTVYERRGFKKVKESAKQWIYEKTDASLTVRVQLNQTHNRLFAQMGEPNVNVVLYTGHSNLGGNVSDALAKGPEQRGDKLVLLAMCRGQQNMSEFALRYPAQFITTQHPSYFSSVGHLSVALVDALCARADYQQMRQTIGDIDDEGSLDNYMFPDQLKRFQYYDLDDDGVIDGEAHDRLFDVSLHYPTGTRVDLTPVPNDTPVEEISGEKVISAVQFLNTLATYHVDHGGSVGSALTWNHMDAFRSNGWFEGPQDEAVRLEKVGQEYKVSINKVYATQSPYAVGALVQYEIYMQLAQQAAGSQPVTKGQVLRALLMAGEYLSYMYCTDVEARAIMAALTARSDIGPCSMKMISDALETDDHGYVTDQQRDALAKAMNIDVNEAVA